MKVVDLMQTDLKTIGTDATIGEAVDALAAAQVTALPVLDRFGRAVGVLSTREVLNAESGCHSAAQRDWLFDKTLVIELMTSWPATIDPDLDVRQAAQEMLYLNVPRLFVEFEGALVGVISQTDIIRAVATAKV